MYFSIIISFRNGFNEQRHSTHSGEPFIIEHFLRSFRLISIKPKKKSEFFIKINHFFFFCFTFRFEITWMQYASENKKRKKQRITVKTERNFNIFQRFDTYSCAFSHRYTCSFILCRQFFLRCVKRTCKNHTKLQSIPAITCCSLRFLLHRSTNSPERLAADRTIISFKINHNINKIR